MKPQKGLGRGLDLIFSNEKIETATTSQQESLTKNIPLKNITPNTDQPRREFAEEELLMLAESIKELGIIQPITLRSNGGENYTIISGERRWRAARMANMETIPAYIREVDDEQMHTMALVENLQREDLNPLEVAFALQRLIDECGVTQETLAKKVSMKRSSISNYLRLLRLSEKIQYALKSGKISMGHAKALASVDDPEAQETLLKLCIEQSISVRQTEAMAQKMMLKQSANTPAKANKEPSIPNGYEGLAQHLKGIFPKGIAFKSNSRGGGQIVINYSNQNELQQFITELNLNE